MLFTAIAIYASIRSKDVSYAQRGLMTAATRTPDSSCVFSSLMSGCISTMVSSPMNSSSSGLRLFRKLSGTDIVRQHCDVRDSASVYETRHH